MLGHPVEHSLSPLLHGAAYVALGLDWEYSKHDVAEGGLASFVAGLGAEWAGLSLTMPLKLEAVRLADFVEPTAKAVGAANTLLFQQVGDTRQTIAANTDVHGIVAALREAGLAEARTAVILGGGATATSAMAALAQFGVADPYVVVRNRGRAAGLLRATARMGTEPKFIGFEDAARALAVADVVVSTIPADAQDAVAGGLGDVAQGAALLDAIYSPPETPLLAAWHERGGVPVGGVRMLLHQAAEQVRLMTGLPAPIAEMDAALMSHFSH